MTTFPAKAFALNCTNVHAVNYNFPKKGKTTGRMLRRLINIHDLIMFTMCKHFWKLRLLSSPLCINSQSLAEEKRFRDIRKKQKEERSTQGFQRDTRWKASVSWGIYKLMAAVCIVLFVVATQRDTTKTDSHGRLEALDPAPIFPHSFSSHLRADLDVLKCRSLAGGYYYDNCVATSSIS